MNQADVMFMSVQPLEGEFLGMRNLFLFFYAEIQRPGDTIKR